MCLLLDRIKEFFYLRRELIVFAGDMHNEKWFVEGREPVKHSPYIDVEIRKAGPDDLEKFSKILPVKRLKMFAEWFKKGHEAFIALKDGEIVYYQLLAFSDFYHRYIEMEFKIKEDEVYPIDVYTLPEYRMKNIHLAVDSLLFAYCKSIKRYKLVATASPDKFTLFQVMYKRGGLCTVHPIRSIVYTKVLGLKYHKVKEL